MDMAVQQRQSVPTADVAELIRKLHDLRDRDRLQPKFFEWPQRLTIFATLPLHVAAVGFVLLLIAPALVAVGWFLVPKIEVAAFALFVQMMALCALTLQTAGGALGSWLEHRNGGKIVAWRAERDARLATGLMAWAPSTLSLCDRWLEGEVKQIEGRLSMFFGGIDKVALFTLVGLGWAVSQEAQKSVFAAHPNLTICGIAFFVGLALGGMVSRASLQHLVYQRDLIALSKLIREERDAKMSP